MSVLGSIDGFDGDGGGRRVVAEMPVYLPHGRRKGKQKSPQEHIDEFWDKFTTKAPGKATTIIPHNQYAARLAKRESAKAAAGGTLTQSSYEETAALCREKVAKIVRECRRINQRYRDPHFDLEFDLKMRRRDCLESLDNIKDSDDEDSDADSADDQKKKGKRRGRRRSGSSDSTRSRIVVAQSKEDGPPGFGPGPVPIGPASNRFNPQAVKRVADIFDDPKFYIDGPTANDVRQGRDGDCWLMAALCTLSNKPGLIEKICVARDEKVGVYGFIFHRDGDWFSEIIDDKLYLTKPDYDEGFLERILWEDRERVNSEETYRKTYQSNSGALYFAQCEDANETWLPLLEKAYAKAHGDYSAIEGGFTGEGIEDLTGGVTSELFTTDILDKEYFWKEQLMKVNDEFLFGCSTAVWGRTWGDRRGIVELHAYSVMKAVEVDKKRLLLLKNPWGKHEWKGPWSDGSKEWTAEWLQKLNHRFGDDGAFWISYEDLLRKYQVFDRTRLFGPEWKVASIWATLSVPWTLEYHPTRFAFRLSKPGPVVIVLSQLDDRYFRGLEGQYRFDLSFRLHKNDEDDYVVRSGTTYRMNRSVNVELDLEAGEYTVLVKIDAKRDDRIKSVESVVKANARSRREKLIRIGLAYDLAHSKGKIIESAEDKEARKAAEERMKERARKKFREHKAKQRERNHYLSRKHHEREKRKNEKKQAKKKDKAEKKKAEAEAKQKEEEAKKTGTEKSNETSTATTADAKGKLPALTKSDSSLKKVTIALPESSEKQKEESKDTDSNNSTSEGQNTPSVDSPEAQPAQAAGTEQPTAADVTKVEDTTSQALKPEESFQTAREGEVGESRVLEASRAADGTPRTQENATNAIDVGTQTEAAVNIHLGPGVVASDEIDSDVPPDMMRPGQKPSKQKSKHHWSSRPHGMPPPPPPNMMFRGSPGMGRGMYGMSPPPMPFGANPFGPQHMRQPPLPGMRPKKGRGSPAGSGYDMGSGSDEDSDDTVGSLSTMSAMSDREIDIMLETQRRHGRGYHSPPPPPLPYGSKDPDDAKDPWNAVAVVSLRVYYKLPEDADPLDEIVTLKIERPNRYALEEEEDDERKKGNDSSSVKSGEGEQALDTSKVLDVDDSAKDATLGDEEGERERRKSLAASAESSFRVEDKAVDADGADTAKE